MKNKGWVEFLGGDIQLYPLQLANCDRIEKNDCIYIFDEVGTGKTISSGLMALHYLYNNPNEKVLIIMPNALYKHSNSEKCGQFLSDWYEKLPFNRLGYELNKQIFACNNHNSNIIKMSNEKYGLIIIDEAHEFLSENTYRYSSLMRLAGEKVVFLTATPIKNSIEDLYMYVKIGEEITSRKLSSGWIEEITKENLDKNQTICSTFDITKPVTRYFKDTVMSLAYNNVEIGNARRLLANVWSFDGQSNKNKILLEKINECYKEKPNENKFIIFTRYIDYEAKEIGDYLHKIGGFANFDEIQSDEKTYKVITGENSHELKRFNGQFNLPTVLILTYQIAEQGVNLPGFNHVINYHIPSTPSKLEQRFGRIDRMGEHKRSNNNISISFLLNTKYDLYSDNFNIAFNTYINQLIPFIPSKNTIIFENVLDEYEKTRNESNVESVKEIEELLKSEEVLANTRAQLKEYMEHMNTVSSSVNELTEFVLARFDDLDIMEMITNEVDSKLLRSKIKDRIKKEKDSPKLNHQELKKVISEIEYKIFYRKTKNYTLAIDNLVTIDAINDCAKYISSSENYKIYMKEEYEMLKYSNILDKCKVELNKFFENAFLKNDFHSIFPFVGYEILFASILENNQFSSLTKLDKEYIITNNKVVMRELPFFKMCNMFKGILQEARFTKTGKIKEKFPNAPNYSLLPLFDNLIDVIEDIGLSDEFLQVAKEQNSYKLFIINLEGKELVEASNWHKLVYHYTRKEEMCYIRESGNYLGRYLDADENEYFQFEEKMKSANNKVLDKSTDQNIFSTYLAIRELEGEYRANECSEYYKILGRERITNIYSLYQIYINGKIDIKEEFRKPSMVKIKDCDYWTQGIVNDLSINKQCQSVQWIQYLNLEGEDYSNYKSVIKKYYVFNQCILVADRPKSEAYKKRMNKIQNKHNKLGR